MRWNGAEPEDAAFIVPTLDGALMDYLPRKKTSFSSKPRVVFDREQK